MAYSKRKPKKPGRSALPNGRSGAAHTSPPYASIPASMLAGAAFKALSPTAVRVLLLFHAAYDPNKELFVSQSSARKLLFASPNTISGVYEEIERAGFLVKLRQHTRPGGMGSAGKGKAAVYDLPGRKAGLPMTWRRAGDPGRTGSWRIHSERLRARLKSLPPAAVKLWCYCHAVDRRRDGGPLANEPRPIRPSDCGLSGETLRRAKAELCSAGIIRLVSTAAGSRPEAYALTQAECKGLRASADV